MIFPPRPTKAIMPGLIKNFERRGWWAQIKWNGTCTVIGINQNREVDFKTRHGEPHKAWTPKPGAIQFFQNFPGSIFVGELLHNKGPGVKDTLYLFDVLSYLGTSLVGTTFEERQTGPMLAVSKVTPLSATVWVAENHQFGLSSLWKEIEHDKEPLVEGLVLKNPKGILEFYHKESSNQGWQVKCRLPKTSYSF